MWIAFVVMILGIVVLLASDRDGSSSVRLCGVGAALTLVGSCGVNVINDAQSAARTALMASPEYVEAVEDNPDCVVSVTRAGDAIEVTCSIVIVQ